MCVCLCLWSIVQRDHKVNEPFPEPTITLFFCWLVGSVGFVSASCVAVADCIGHKLATVSVCWALVSMGTVTDCCTRCTFAGEEEVVLAGWWDNAVCFGDIVVYCLCLSNAHLLRIFLRVL